MPRAKKEQSGNIFKIRDSATGLWSGGGAYPYFSTKGKTWSNIRYVKTHLRQFEQIPPTWEVVEIEMRECAVNEATNFFTPCKSPSEYRTTAPGMTPLSKAPKALLGASGLPPAGFVQLASGSALAQMQSVLQAFQGIPLQTTIVIKKNKP